MTPSYDWARQFGKTYVGALNTGPEAFAALFAPGAVVQVGDREGPPELVREATPPGRSAFRRARIEEPWVVLTVRIIDRPAERVDDHAHRLQFDDAGRITALRA